MLAVVSAEVFTAAAVLVVVVLGEYLKYYYFSAVMLLVGQQEGHPAYKTKLNALPVDEAKRLADVARMLAGFNRCWFKILQRG